MKVLFIVYHPVDPYIVFETAAKIEKDGGETFFIIVEKENIIKKIVDSKGFKNKVIGESKKSFTGKVVTAFNIIYQIYNITKRFKPDIVFSPTGPYTSFAFKYSKIPLICWEDTETATFNYKYSYKRIDSLLLVEPFYLDISAEKIIRFNGYKELAYLHPNIFKPNPDVLKELNLSIKDKIVLMRFSALNAMHDIGLTSEVLTNEDKILNFIKKIEKKYQVRVFISMTERNLSDEFKNYRLNLAPDKYTHLLAFCTLYLGEGTTTASEAGVLGVPWINIQHTKRGYLIDQEENYSLGFRTDNLEYALEKAEEFLQDDKILEQWKLKRGKLLKDKIDVSGFLTWFLTNYPDSHHIMKRNPNYQNQFK